MKNNAILSGGYVKNQPILEWLWEILEEYDDSQRASFHFFITGTYNISV